MLRKLPAVVQTPRIAGTPARAEQVLCPPKVPTRSVPNRGVPQRWTQCYTPVIETFVQFKGDPGPPHFGRLITQKVQIIGPVTCFTTWRTAVGQ